MGQAWAQEVAMRAGPAAAALGLALALTGSAVAQEGLSAPPLPPDLPQPPALDGQAPSDSPERPLRAQYRFAFSLEQGWNTLSGLGSLLTVNLHPHLALDGGLGVGLSGLKGGARARVNLLTTGLTPFISFGVMTSTGSRDPQVLPDLAESPTNPNLIRYQVLSPTHWQVAVGLDFIGERGTGRPLTASVMLGWATLYEPAISIVEGVPTSAQRQVLALLYGSGWAMGSTLGWAF
jgi:hypothetical protein